MNDNTHYRMAMLVIFVASVAISGYHRIQAAKSKEQISRRDEGRLLFWSIRLGGLLMFIGTLLYLINPAWMHWADLAIPDEVRWAGAVLGLCSLLLLYWTLSTLGRNLTDTVAIRANHTLVTGGPYQWVRHPFYVSMLLLICSVTLLSANWFIGFSGLLVFLLLAFRTSIEERKLIERFGDDYRSYMRNTKRFIPWLW
ncbi:Isoprenylcysteine carboxyl methyltransferase (ICMT) family protein [Symmachiella dynata]|uniref:methyltransferase family protein n=1 Tax=Symmachiella dynata TaxID=2527995 RepID=UPI00118CDC2D|nr:isoprenylcysteine carboxylmethyltransferase family protein [Symmachiella dynata]QDT48881.1 Isoprenylcysteine carboxyl methyltransferase (ICMT) family protein [Symmachiella dynata]